MSARLSSSPANGTITPNLNPITVEVIGSAFESIVEEMGEALVRASYSTNIKERRDCSTALFDASGTLYCQAEHIPIHLGSLIDFIPLIIERYKLDDIRSGDIFVGNDAYEGGGTHLPDINLAEPIFYEEQLIGWAVNTAHHSDFADRGDAHIFQEGLRIPPLKLYREGLIQKDILDLILINCQVPDERVSDFRSQMAANRLGVTRMQALCEKYGPDVVVGVGQELQDYAERRMRAAIQKIPDGVYQAEEEFDAGGVPIDMHIAVTITVRGDEMDLYFESSPQVRGSINMTYTALLASVYYAIKSIVDPGIPANSGLARPLHVIAEEGTILNCVSPAAVFCRTTTSQRVPDLIMLALADALPRQITGASSGSMGGVIFVGHRPDRSIWIHGETIGGGGGARFNKDGLDTVHMHMTNTSNLPVEALEGEFPLTIVRYEMIPNSGGEGTYRGGTGIRRVYRANTPCRVTAGRDSRFRTRPWGAHGALPGAVGGYRITVPGQDTPLKPGEEVPAGGIIEVFTPGGGGYGPPSGRSREHIIQDMTSGVITADRALEAYGYEA
jgi:N-methylhydantoinase B